MIVGLEETLAQTGGGVSGRLEGARYPLARKPETAIPACKYGRPHIVQ
jgi:hypothetical protein